MKTKKLLLNLLLKQAKNHKKASGFTLIELLVGLIIAFFVITPLLGLAVSLLDTDRKEQAKSTSEQEIQAAADFIVRDLQQAVFIYDANGLTQINSPNNAAKSGIKNQIPPEVGTDGCKKPTDCRPVLAFWKRRPIQDAVPRDSFNNKSSLNCTNANDEDECDDSFVYSLVVYYLILGDSTKKTWSETARIARFEISDGVRYLGGQQIESGKSKREKDKGFEGFTLDKDVAAAMNTWVKESGVNQYTQSVQVVADYIDREEIPAAQQRDLCPTDWTLTPDKPTYGFYACVNQEDNIARFYLGGNALARIRPRDQHDEIKCSDEGLAAYCPTVNAEVKAIGQLVQ
ncbi:MAG: hormogonium polysaccharide secretion pseudopilin HpsC [Cyanobacteriota bacterium]|nr:hormogonium polysaccharide secretion pseudopilin HpsC [Cyanobacteriota bacterium]